MNTQKNYRALLRVRMNLNTANTDLMLDTAKLIKEIILAHRELANLLQSAENLNNEIVTDKKLARSELLFLIDELLKFNRQQVYARRGY